jgi:hypothetical protein
MREMTARPDRDATLVRLLAKDAISDAILRFARGADSSDLARRAKRFRRRSPD